ncbi:MAG: DUF1145 domain-containing protein [Pseudomonadota bacterium]
MSKAASDIVLIIASIIWVGLLYNLAQPFPPPWDKILNYFALGVFIIHALELAMFRKLLGASGNAKLLDSMLILISGAFFASYLAKVRADKTNHTGSNTA